MALTYLNVDRKNIISIAVTEDGTAYGLTGCTLHFSVLKDDGTELFHISESTHTTPADGLSEIEISKTNAALMSGGHKYRWELSLHDASGDDWGLEAGDLEAINYRGSLT